ncbi:MAG: hypothetical protein IEMM0008_0031 [bacterium]|nr:MAG: hypothetical protein IEMM0008_0031 [bacterium]
MLNDSIWHKYQKALVINYTKLILNCPIIKPAPTNYKQLSLLQKAIKSRIDTIDLNHDMLFIILNDLRKSLQGVGNSIHIKNIGLAS